MSEEYLTISQVAKRLSHSPKTVRNKMAAGVFQKGVHYFKPQAMSPRFKWSAVVAWMEQGREQRTRADEDSIPMARGYQLGNGQEKKISVAPCKEKPGVLPRVA